MGVPKNRQDNIPPKLLIRNLRINRLGVGYYQANPYDSICFVSKATEGVGFWTTPSHG